MHRFTKIIFIVVLILAPTLFGTVEQWSLTIMQTLCLSATLLLLLSVYLRGSPVYRVPALVPLFCFLGYLLFQMIPLPPALVQIISPATHALYMDTLGQVDTPEWMALSIHPRATLSEFFRFSAYISFYVLSVHLLSQRTFLKKTLGIVIVFASLTAILAIVDSLTAIPGAQRKIYWFRELTQGGAPFGPYVNRNHYAGWMGMIFPIVLSLFLFYKPTGMHRSIREKIIAFLTQDRTNTRILLGLSAILILASIFLCLSRGGIISICLAALFLGVMVTLKRPGYGKGVLMICGFAFVLLCIGWFGWEPIFNRFDAIWNVHGDIAGQRPILWADSLNLVKDFPVTGSGFGTFMDLYPKYRHFPGNMVVKHAHNDYLEFLAEGGIIGVFLVFWFLAVFIYKSLRVFRKRNDRYSIYLYLGSLAGIISILLHGLTDFNLHIGANGLYFFFLVGLAVSAANTRISYRQADTYLNRLQLPLSRNLVPLIAVLCLVVLFVNLGGFIGELSYASIKGIHLGQDTTQAILAEVDRRARRANRLDPLEAKYRFAAGNIETFRSNDELALRQYRAALRLNPTRGEYLKRLAIAFSAQGNFDTSEKLFRAAVQYHPKNPQMYLDYAAWLLSQGHTQDAKEHLKHAIVLDPGKTENSLILMSIHGVADQEMQAAIPERVEPYIRFADFILQTGNVKLAEASYHRALEFAKNEKMVKVGHFNRVYQFYIKHDRIEDALAVLQKAIEVLPANPHLRIKMAALYEQVGITYRAVEEYRNALMMNPKNRKARTRLEKILSE